MEQEEEKHTCSIVHVVGALRFGVVSAAKSTTPDYFEEVNRRLEARDACSLREVSCGMLGVS